MERDCGRYFECGVYGQRAEARIRAAIEILAPVPSESIVETGEHDPRLWTVLLATESTDMIAGSSSGHEKQPDIDASDVTVAFRAFGLSIGVVLCDPVHPDDLRRVLPPGHELIAEGALDHVFRLKRIEAGESPVLRAGYHWFDGDEAVESAYSRWQAIKRVESVIEHHVAEFSPDFIFIHAGVVTWRGAALIFPGESRSGKSTLVRALVEAGATYYSDEYAVLDSAGRVYPYLRHLSQRKGPFGPRGRVDMSARVPSAGVAKAGAPVTLVVLTQFEEGSAWRAERLAPGVAMMAMSQHVIAIRRRPADAFAVMRRVAEGAVVVAGVRGDATDAASRILAALDAGEAADEPTDTIARRLVG